MKIIFWLLLISGLTIFSILIANTILPFFIAFTLAYILEPLIDTLYTKYKFPRSIIVYTILITFLSSVIILLTLVLPLLYHQIALLIGKIPVYKTYLQSELIPQLTNKLHTIDPTIADKIQSSSQTFINNTMSMLGKIVNNIWEYTMATINVLVLLFLVPIILLYLLRDWPKIIKHLEELLPLAKKELISILLSNINQLLSAYVRGQLNICFLLAAFYCIGLSIIGIDFGLLLGIISGVLIIVPIIGTVISIAIAIAIGYFTFGCTIKIVYIIALYIVGHIMESYIMTPKIIGSKIGLHPLWIIFSVFASGNLFGFIGIFFAIPIAGIIKVLLCYAIDVYKSSAIYKS